MASNVVTRLEEKSQYQPSHTSHESADSPCLLSHIHLCSEQEKLAEGRSTPDAEATFKDNMKLTHILLSVVCMVAHESLGLPAGLTSVSQSLHACLKLPAISSCLIRHRSGTFLVD